MAENISRALDDICNRKKMAYLQYEDMERFANCYVIKIPKPIITSWNGIVLNKRSPYTRILNRM